MISVSVIVPVYNAQEHLRECIESICAQTQKDIEIICVDDGSTDASPEILAELASHDERIIILRQENVGAGAARNYGMAMAKGKYYLFLDADDFFHPRMLEEAYNKAEADRAEITVFGADFYYEKLKSHVPCTYSLRENMLPTKRPFAGTDVEKDIFKVIVGWAWDKLFLADFVKQKGLKFQEQRTSNDLLFVFSAFACAKRITTLPQVLVHQRRLAGKTLSVTREKSWMCFYQALTALRNQLKDWGLYQRFEQDYINYALHFSLWNLNTLSDPTRKKVYIKLRESWFRELGITDYPREKFYHAGEYAQYVQVMKWPYSKTLQKVIGFIQRGVTWVNRKLRK